MYNQKIIDLFYNPINAGAMKDASVIGLAQNEDESDKLKLYLKINNEGIIEDATFEAYGCIVAIASLSMLTQLIKGKKVDDALKVDIEQIAKQFGGIPEHKIKCSALAIDAIENAIKNFYKKKKNM